MDDRRQAWKKAVGANAEAFARRVVHAAKWRAEARLKRAFGLLLVDGWIERQMGRYIQRYAGPGTTFLDVGCGVDMRLGAYLPSGLVYTGIDIDPDVVNTPLARRAGYRVQVADAREMPFADGSFSLIASMEVLYEIPDWQRVLEEMKRVSVPGGVVVLSVPNGHCHKYARKGPHPRHRSACAFTEYTTALREAGFAVVESRMLGWWLPVLTHSKYSIMFPLASKDEFYNCNFFFVCRSAVAGRKQSPSP